MKSTHDSLLSTAQIDALVLAVRDLKPQDSFFGPEFVASIVGAIVGGLIAAGIQYYSYWEQRQDRILLEKKRQAANAFSILTKINRAYTTISTVKRQVDKAALECVRRGISLSSGFEAFSGDMPRFDLTADEVEFLRTTKDGDLISDVLNLPHIHDMYVDTLSLLRNYKYKILELQESTFLRPDGTGTSVFSGPNASRARLEKYQADKLVASLIGFTLKDEPRTRALLKNSQIAFIELVGKEHIGPVWDVGNK
jgi:hypothetical protein